MNIAIVDDHDLIREGLHAVLAIRGVNSVEKFICDNLDSFAI